MYIQAGPVIFLLRIISLLLLILFFILGFLLSFFVIPKAPVSERARKVVKTVLILGMVVSALGMLFMLLSNYLFELGLTTKELYEVFNGGTLRTLILGIISGVISGIIVKKVSSRRD